MLAITQLLEVTARNSEAVNRHDQVLSRLEANSVRYDDAINCMEDAIANLSNTVTNLSHTVASNNTKMEQAITNLTTTVANNNTRLTDRLDAIAEQSAAERETFIAEIREIWRYLRYQPRLGRTGHDDA